MISTDRTAILEKTIELCQTILDDPEFQAIRRQVDLFQEDDGVQAEYRDLSELGAALQEKQRAGLAPEAEAIANFERRRDAFLQNPVARGFLDAQQSMHDIRDTVSKYVTRTFELGRMPQPEDFHSCGCGSGCGCG